MAYQHGIYGVHEAYAGKLGTGGGTVPAYIDTAPIWQLNSAGAANFDYSPYLNKPILIQSYRKAKEKIGYSEDYADFGLSEAVAVHFLLFGTGPIVVVNVADPSKLESAATTKAVTVTGKAGAKAGYLDDPLAALENISVTGLEAGKYTLEYEDGKVKITVTDLTFTDSTVTMTYKRVDVSDTAITTEAFQSGVDALDYCELQTNKRPNLLLSPRYSGKPGYHTLLLEKAEAKLGEKWETILLSDLPATAEVNTPALAKAWKATNSYINELDKDFWPMAMKDSTVYHAAVFAAAVWMEQDTENDDVPYISLDNKDSGADAACLEDGTQVLMSEPEANDLNEAGITTFNLLASELRFWGCHMGNYEYENEDNIDPEYRQDTSIRMGIYLRNYLKYNFVDRIGSPMARRDIDAIIASVQQWLNGLVNEGKLLLATVSFEEDDNSSNSMASGDFIFEIEETYTPSIKSLTFKDHYTADGLSALTESDGE